MSATEKCSAGSSKTSSTGAAENYQTGEKIILCHWKNRTAPLVPLKNALLVHLKHTLLALLKKIKLLKKSYCFTSATEKNQWASLKKSDCSTSAAEKYSVGTSETHSAGNAKKKLNCWKNCTASPVPLKKNRWASLKKSDCSTSATEKYPIGTCETHSAGTAEKKKQIALLVLLKKSDCSTGTTETLQSPIGNRLLVM